MKLVEGSLLVVWAGGNDFLQEYEKNWFNDASWDRQIAHAPNLDWPRWRALQHLAKGILRETESPTLTDLPPLEYLQTKRVDHRLILRRH